MSKPRVVIVGGGFGGMKAALELAKGEHFHITLISDHPYFRYYPGLYHTATGGRRKGTRISVNDILGHRPVTFAHATATKLDRKKKVVKTKESKDIPYDILILALGNVTNYFGIKGLQEYSFGIKSTEEAERFKNHLHAQLKEDGHSDLNYIIIGGGPTGIELAGTLPVYLHEVMEKHGLATRKKLHITLVEAAPRLLPRSPKDIARAVTKRLHKLGVTVMTGQAVEGLTADALTVGGKPLPSHTVVWTAGVTNHPFFKENCFTLTKRGKVQVDDYLQAEPDIYVLGDNADTEYSGMAQTALYDGEFVAGNLQRQLHQEMPHEYVPKKPISVIPVGPRWAAVEWGKTHLTGWLGWILRALADLVAFKDLESWPKAGKQWLMSMDDETLDCPNCGKSKGDK